MKAMMGIYDSSLGARSNETSGKAILAKERQADTSNFHFSDNQNRAIRGVGEILVDIIPSVYGARQTIRILGEDQKEEVVGLVQRGQDANPKGSSKLYDLSTGRYDVVVKSGPSFASQREETRETLIEIMRTVPGAGQFIGDIVMEHLDFQGADRVAKRLKMLLPEELRQAEDKESAGDLPEEQQAVLNQANQTIQALKQALEEAKSEKMPEMERLNIEKAESAINMEVKKVELQIKQEELELKKRQNDFKEVQDVLGGTGNGASQAKPSAPSQQIVIKASSEYEEMDRELKADLASRIVQAIDGLAMAQAAPTKIMRDENGKAVGAVKEVDIPPIDTGGDEILEALNDLTKAQTAPVLISRDEAGNPIGTSKDFTEGIE
jgi:hypothetical protein